MRLFYLPQQDVSLYSEFPNRQTGLDEILETGKNENGTHRIHSLIQFELNEIIALMNSGYLPLSTEFDLKLYVARLDKLFLNQVIVGYLVSESWSEGSGYFYQDIVEETDGATWRYKSTGSLWALTGSSFISTPSSSVSMSVPVSDVTMNVTHHVRSWISGTIPNNGLLLTFPNSDEINDKNQGRVYFFSRNTHTIFSPTLVVKWDDSQYTTGSLTAAPQSNLSVVLRNLNASYNRGEVVRVDIAARSLYPLKTFSTVFTSWTGSSYLPSSSYYSIVDARSGKTIIPFDNFSKISCDSTGNYLKFSTANFEPLRYYKLLIKTVNPTYQHIFDKFTFSINP